MKDPYEEINWLGFSVNEGTAIEVLTTAFIDFLTELQKQPGTAIRYAFVVDLDTGNSILAQGSAA